MYPGGDPSNMMAHGMPMDPALMSHGVGGGMDPSYSMMAHAPPGMEGVIGQLTGYMTPPQDIGLMGQQQGVGPWLYFQPSPVENNFYQSLWQTAEPQGQGFMAGGPAAEFLGCSGLPRQILHEIWNIADSDNSGCLTPDKFFAACRLVALAQNGVPLTPESIAQEPVTLPNFDLSLMSRRSTSELSMQPDQWGGQALGTMMDPNAAAMGVEGTGMDGGMRPMLLPGQGDSWGMETQTMGGESWAVADADKSKFFELFLKHDFDGDGYVEGVDAQGLMRKSKLPDSELSLIWSLADRDQDGKLSVEEFLIATQLVTKRKKGHPLPPMLPPDLCQSVITPAFPSSSPGSISGFEPSAPATTDFATAFPSIGEAPEGFGGTFGDSDANLTSDKPQKKSKSRKKKTEKVEVDDEAVGADSEVTFGDMVRDESAKGLARDSVDKEWDLSGVDSRRGRSGRYGRDRAEGYGKAGETSSSLIDAIVEADREMGRLATRDVDEQADMLRHLTGVTEAQKAELNQERSELQRQLERRRTFERQVAEMKFEYDQVKEERRKLDMERISVGRDVDHYQEEILFLKQQVEDIRTDIKMLSDATEVQEKKFHDTELQTRHLDTARKNTLQSLHAERELLKTETREIEEMRQTLERLRREKEGAQAKNVVSQERARQVGWMQSPNASTGESGRPPLEAMGRYSVSAQHSWAGTMGQSQLQSKSKRDSKGIPTASLSSQSMQSAVIASSIPGRQGTFRSVDAESYRSAAGGTSRFASVGGEGLPPHWETFGSSKGQMDRSDRRRGVASLMKTDVGSRFESTMEQREASHLGSRRSDADFGHDGNVGGGTQLKSREVGGFDFEKGEPSEDEGRRISTGRRSKRKSKKNKDLESGGDSDGDKADAWPSFVDGTEA